MAGPEIKSRRHERLGKALRSTRREAGFTLASLVPRSRDGHRAWSSGYLSKVERGLEAPSKELIDYYISRCGADRIQIESLYESLPKQRGRPRKEPTPRRRPLHTHLPPAHRTLAGVWLSEYEYETSSQPGVVQTSGHYVVLKQTGTDVKGRSLRQRSKSRLELTGFVERTLLLTAYWRERTSKNRIYHGALQVLIDPVNSTMSGSWVGFNRRTKVETGIWQFRRLDHRTDPRTIRRYDNLDPVEWTGPPDDPPPP